MQSVHAAEGTATKSVTEKTTQEWWDLSLNDARKEVWNATGRFTS